MSVTRQFALLAFLSLVPNQADADVLLTPFVGGNLGGSTDTALTSFLGAPSRTTFGGSIALMAGGVFGVEADFGYAPHFFGVDVDVAGVPVGVLRNNVLTASVNLTAGIPVESADGRGLRPYGVVGIGLIRQQFDLVGGLFGYRVNDVGYNLGGGVMLFVSRNVGIRGDVRHFRTLNGGFATNLLDFAPGAFNFTRATVGVTFRY